MTKSDELNCKVDDVSAVLDEFKCAFKELKEDVEVLESAEKAVAGLSGETGPALEQHAEEITAEYDEIAEDLEEKKEMADLVHQFTHPCGGHGWKEIINFDFRRADSPLCTDLSSDFAAANTVTGLSQTRPHVCVAGIASATGATSAGGCLGPVAINSATPYSSVCGRIAAYQIGSAGAFFNVPAGENSINYPYLSGISLTRGGTLDDTTMDLATHIWSFVVGLTKGTVPSAHASRRCPCEAGAPSPPAFVGEDYFCESSATADLAAAEIGDFNGMPFTDNVLWDGLGCEGTTSTCCSRENHPYFVKHLGESSPDPIDMRFCFTNLAANEQIAVEQIQLYVK